MRRWNVWRIIGIPMGHQRHIDRDEELAKENREAILALAILQKVLWAKKPKDLEWILVRLYRYAFLEVEMTGSEVGDRSG